MVKVLFVCTGNICRSPTAEAVLRHMVDQAGLSARIAVDSAGLEAFHVGEPPDPRSIKVARAYGYRLETLRARQVHADDFYQFDRILAMDKGHYRALTHRSPPRQVERVRLFLDGVPDVDTREVPDPYYGGPDGFVRVLKLIEAGARHWLAALIKDAQAGSPWEPTPDTVP